MNSPFGDTDWRRMSREQLDAGFNNAAAVADSAAIASGWQQRSADMRARYPAQLDLSYGSRPRNRIDFLKVADGAPTLLFIHGGYWQMRAKEDFTCLMAGPLAQGINVGLIGYTLAPDAMLDEIVAEIHAGIDMLAARLPALGGDPVRLVLAGWSAGGHLTAMALAHPAVKAGVAISGIYDLEPIRHSYLNEKLQLDEAMARRNSPLMQQGGADKPLALVVGGGELAPLRQQTADFAAHRASLGLPVSYEEIPGANHYSILRELDLPHGRITTLIRQMLERAGG